jgi:transketolase
MTDIDQLAINTMRILAVDAVQHAKSGHPGTPMDAAPAAYTLWQRVLRYDPAHPTWMNRDRFVLSSGHASMLLYSLIFLAGIKTEAGVDAITLDDIKTFRQADSRCPGHPEYGWTAGVETTTGPLGQGASTSVGMAIARQWLGATYNRRGFDLFDFNVYAFCGDGDMMEGITSEAASLAAHLKLANLCWIYDSNRVTIEGSTDLAFSEDVAARFQAYGWHILHVTDANDTGALEQAYHGFLRTNDRPTLIVVNSHIAYGSPHKHDSADAHGEPLGEEEVRLIKEFFGFDPNLNFHVPSGVREHFADQFGARGARERLAWEQMFERYGVEHPDLAEQVACIRDRRLPAQWEDALPAFPSATNVSTRDASGKVLNALAQKIPWIIGGAADLAPSTRTRLTFDQAGDFLANRALGNYQGRNMHFGVREHAMCAAVNGMTLTGLCAYGSGFLIFTDYARGSIRLAAVMELPVLHIWTHDSISLGEDGPTHQPIEHLISLRAIPGMVVIRPADANEMTEAYRYALRSRNRPVALICTRQGLPVIDRTQFAAASGLARGAYVLADAPHGRPDVILIASGSEVSLCMAARDHLSTEGINARVVSMPSAALFEEQDAAYIDAVLPPAITARVSVEESSPLGWHRYVGSTGVILGMRSFGMSAPIKVVMEHFGFTADHIAAAARQVVKS